MNVTVTGDTAVEPTETFTVKLANPTNATLKTATATGTITNDDTRYAPTAGRRRPLGTTFYAPMSTWVAGRYRPAGDQPDQRRRIAVHRGVHASHPRREAGLGGAECACSRRHQRPGPAINRSIKALQAAGGDVMISLGGQAGTSLAQWGSAHGMTAAQLANAYAGVIDTYGITHLDFDIEGAAVAEPASIALHSQAFEKSCNSPSPRCRSGTRSWSFPPD